jgi:hypothetical protein
MRLAAPTTIRSTASPARTISGIGTEVASLGPSFLIALCTGPAPLTSRPFVFAGVVVEGAGEAGFGVAVDLEGDWFWAECRSVRT